MKKIYLLALLTLLSIFLAACSSSSADSSDNDEYVLNYQGFASTVLFPELAEELGYFEKVKLNWIGDTQSGPQDIQAVATGDTDFGGAFNAAIVNLAINKAPVTAVIGWDGVDEKKYNGLYVKEDSPIQEASDLIGKKVGMNTVGALSEFTLKLYLEQNGLTEDEIKQIEIVTLPSTSTEQAIQNGQVDAAFLGWLSKDAALDRGGIRELVNDYEIYGDLTFTSYVMHDKFIKENPEAVKDFVQGTAKAIEWARAASTEEVIEKFTTIAEKRKRSDQIEIFKFYKSTGIAGPGGVLEQKSFDIWIDRLVKEGQIKEGQVDASTIFTNEYNPYNK